MNRRSFVRQTSLLGLGSTLLSKNTFASGTNNTTKSIPLKWIDTKPNGFDFGTTFGLPWKQGELKNTDAVQVNHGKEKLAVQSWSLAYWPDGSIKWSAHAIPATMQLSQELSASIGHSSSTKGITITKSSQSITVDTGTLKAVFPTTGNTIISVLEKNGKRYAQQGKLELINLENEKSVSYYGTIENIEVEQAGNIRAVIKVQGKHQSADRDWLPFTLRFYFYFNSDAVKILHTIVYDGDENKDFIQGLGFTFEIPLQETTYNRHVKFVDAATQGVFSEAIQNLTGLRRDSGLSVRQKQVAGLHISAEEMTQQVQSGLPYIPQWGDYHVAQLHPNGYSITKRTTNGHSWLASHYGNKSYGVGFLGEPNKGIVFGIRNFWQSFPAGIHIENAHQSTAQIKLWLWSPDAEPMELRFYHDGMGQDSYEKQRAALDITYEDYEPGFGRPIGVAKTSELWLKLTDNVPENEKMVQYAQQIQQPLQLVSTPEYLHQVNAFGNNWSLPNEKEERAIKLEKQLDFYFNFYQNQIVQRNWYGFWNYGDIMHSYDADRHNWRYDTGGFAWDNSELSSDLWLWYYFLRTGQSDVFRMAEAMTRHTGEVDVHHIGPFAPLGSRHNVMHWGDSAKQLRISTVTNRRFLYFLTADERIGDLMHEQVNAYKTLQKIAPGRKLPKGSLQQETNNLELVNLAFGTDWGSIAAAWFTEWERTKDSRWLDMLRNSMQSIAEQPHGFFTGGAAMNIRTGIFEKDTTHKVSVSHLNAVFGLPEILTEINASVSVPVFCQAWLQYCTLYNASPDTQQKILGGPLQKLNLQQGHARLTAYAAWITKDKALQALAWKIFEGGKGGIIPSLDQIECKTPDIVANVSEIPTISTNAVAQWSLAAMQILAYQF